MPPTPPDGPVAPPLTTFYMYMTEGCNLACRHCWLAPKRDDDGTRFPVLDVEDIEQALAEAAPLGLQRVKLTGGEPFLHPEIRRVLDLIQAADLQLTVESNGVLLTPEIAARLATFESPSVSISLDGADAATHEDVRGVAGCFEGALAGVRNLVEVGIRPQIIFSLLPSNVHQMEAIVALAEERGASSVKFNIIQPTGRGDVLHSRERVLDVPELIRLSRWVDSDLQRRSSVALFFDTPPAFRSLKRLHGSGGAATCGILGILGLIPGGWYALCGIGELDEEMVFGRVGRDPLASVWSQSNVLRALRDGLPDDLTGTCRTCLMRHMCLGSCIAQNYHSTGNLFSPFWFCEEATRLGLFPPSRVAVGTEEAQPAARPAGA